MRRPCCTCGIPLQMPDGVGGMLVDSTDATAKALELTSTSDRSDDADQTGVRW